MGAFLLVSERNKSFNTEAALKVCGKLCGTNPVKFDFQGWTLWLFGKKTFKETTYRQNDKTFLFCCGTPFIGGMSYPETADAIMSSVDSSGTVPDNLRGLFSIGIIEKDKLRFFNDRYGLYGIWHSTDGTVFSSSFLSLCFGLPVLTLFKDAVLENLLSGSVIGPESIFREIRRSDPSMPFRFPEVYLETGGHPAFEKRDFRTKAESLQYQLFLLSEWFSDFNCLASGQGIKAGITGGLDSRLLLALCKKHLGKEYLTFYSHARKRRDRDYIIGQEICRLSGLNFVSREVTDIDDTADSDLPARMDEGMYFNDGLIRTHSFWHEEFNTSDYVAGIAGESGVSLNGIGGEQYRNMERLTGGGWNRKNWVLNDLLFKYAGGGAADMNTMKHVAESIVAKTDRILSFGSSDKADLLYVKRYLNEVYNPSNRALRAVNENRISFALSPFCDPVISVNSYSAIPFLGTSLEYEAEMIAMLDRDVAAVNSVYGFPFTGKEPLLEILPRVILNNYVPGKIKRALISKGKWGKTARWESLAISHKYFERCAAKAASVKAGINTRALIGRSDLGPLVFAFGHLMLTFEDKICNDECR